MDYYRILNFSFILLCRAGRNAPVVESVTKGEEMELHEKEAANAPVNNPSHYSKIERHTAVFSNKASVVAGEPVSTRPTNALTNFMQVPVPKTNIRSYHMRELAKGNFLVKSEDILLLHCIGEGLSVCVI